MVIVNYYKNFVKKKMLKIVLFLMIVVLQIVKVQSATPLQEPHILRKVKTDNRDPVLQAVTRFFHQSLDQVQYWFYQNFNSWLPYYNKLPWSITHHDAIGWKDGRPVYKPWTKEELEMHHRRHEEHSLIDNR